MPDESTPAVAAPTLIPPAAPAAVPPNGSSQHASAWVKEDGNFAENWIDRLPEGLRGEASLRVMPSLGDLAKSYVETKKMVGTKLEMPGEGATPEQLAAWRKTVGAPENPEGYLGDAKSLRPEAIPENLWDRASETKFLALAHKHHLPPAAVKEILGFHAENLQTALGTSQAMEAETLKQEGIKLRVAWGADYDANLSRAARVAQTVGLDPNKHPAFTDSTIVQAFDKMGKLLSEDKLVKGDTPSIDSALEDRARRIQDPTSQDMEAREYRGEFGPQKAAAVQAILHQIYASRKRT